jgi:hypothetical protein
MKKIYLVLLTAIIGISTGYAQLIQASLGLGTSANRYKIYLRSATAQTPSNISTLQFNVGVSDAISPKPTMTVVSTTLSGVNWDISEATEGGFHNYQLTNTAASISKDIPADTDVEILEVEFTGLPAASSVSLVTLPDGGPSITSLFYCTGSYTSDGSNLYYARPNVTVNNQFSYDETGASTGTATSTATYSAGGTSITDMFRTVQSGNWNTVAVWESSPDGTTWSPATLTPTDASGMIAIRDGHIVSVTAPVTIDETSVAPQGTLIVNDALTVLNEGLVFRSNANFTGMLGTSTGSVTGNVRVERFIPALRAWRLLSVPANSAQTINDAWQNNFGNTPGLGTHITGGSTANGFDQSPTNNPSIKVHNQAANTLVSLASTNVPISNEQGYFLFVRGDRTVNLNQGSTAPATTTNLPVTGSLKTGFQSIPVGSSGFTLIGNPYVSPIDFALVTKTNVADRFYVWDPKRATVGAYVLFENNSGIYEPAQGFGGSYPANNSLIQTGQAFFVESTGGSASIGVNEDDKAVTQQGVFRTSGNKKEQKLMISLAFANTDGTPINADGAVVRFANTYSNEVISEDAGKLDNVDENLAIVRNGKALTSEKRKPVAVEDVIQLKLYNVKERNYNFIINPSNLENEGLEAYLEDAFLNTKTPLSLSSATIVNFSVTSNAMSVNANRFRIVFNRKAAPGITITEGSIKVYPNPLVGKSVNVQFNNQAKGAYTIKVLNPLGQPIVTKKVEHTGGSLTQAIRLPYTLSKGMYQVQITSADSRFIQQVIAE